VSHWYQTMALVVDKMSVVLWNKAMASSFVRLSLRTLSITNAQSESLMAPATKGHPPSKPGVSPTKTLRAASPVRRLRCLDRLHRFGVTGNMINVPKLTHLFLAHQALQTIERDADSTMQHV
jgi:hypothetical protein